jgi:hypothetical protein
MGYNILSIFKYTAQWNFVYEDPDVSKRRIFIQNQAYDTNTLAPKYNELFLGVGVDNIVNNGPQDDWSSTIPIQTNQKWMWNKAYNRQDVFSYVGHSDPWLISLDYDNIPGRHSIRTSAGYNIFQHYSGYSTNTGLSDFWVGQDLTLLPRHLNYNVGMLTTFFYEDPSITEEFYAIRFDNGTYYLGKARVTGTATAFTAARTVTDRNIFFVGKNTDGTALFAEIQGATNNIDFVKITSAATYHPVVSYTHEGVTSHHYQFLSNMRHYSPTRKVFYQGGWDRNNNEEYKQAKFTRYVWNPNSQTIVQTPCRLVYPTGKQHTDYQIAARYEPSLHATTRNNWFYKPHQFTVNGVNYLTFMFIDRSNQSFSTERAYFRNRRNQDTWVTFRIGDDLNDNILYYHSTFQWMQNRNFPTYYMPTNQSGNQMVIIRASDLSTITFDTVLGWVEHDIENISVRSIGIDDSGRILIGAVGTMTWEDTGASRYENSNNKSYGILAEYRPSWPVVISSNVISGNYVTNMNYIYSGTPINTGMAITARNSLNGENVTANVRLIISSGNAVFDNNLREKVITTGSNPINVPITFNGAGRPIVTAHLVI